MCPERLASLYIDSMDSCGCMSAESVCYSWAKRKKLSYKN